MIKDGAWNELTCDRHQGHFMCETHQTVFEKWLDFLDICPQLFDSNAAVCEADLKLAREDCRFTFGYCGKEDTPVCTVGTPGASDGDTKTLTRGMAMNFSCGEGYIPVCMVT